MNKYHLELSACELDTLKATMIITIRNLDKLSGELESMLDEDLEFKQYSLYLSSLASVTKDRANMRSILSQIEAIS